MWLNIFDVLCPFVVLVLIVLLFNLLKKESEANRQKKLRQKLRDPQSEAIQNTLPQQEMHTLTAFRISTFLSVTLAITIIILMYVWLHIHITRLEYDVATAMHTKEQLLEEQHRLKLEVATLKSPQRIEAIARDRLQMSCPEPGQVTVIK